MQKYNFGDVDIKFDTNKIFLLFQILYRLENIEDKINTNKSELSFLSKSIEEFKKIIATSKQGLKEFNIFKENAENKDMWSEFNEYINSFNRTDIEELRLKDINMANTIEKLMNTDFFKEVERLNNEYSKKMEERFVTQTKPHKDQAENIVGKTRAKSIIYMPFTPELFNIEPMCESDKNGNGEFVVPFTIPTNKKAFEETFEMDYTEGIESVILFHEKLHADLPTKSNKSFKNPMLREMDSHLKHAIIELLANGEMGIQMANHTSYFQSVFHIGKIQYNGRTLTTDDFR